MSTAREIEIRIAINQTRFAPVLSRLSHRLAQMVAENFVHVSKRRRKAKGWRRHVRRLKANSK